MIENTDTNPNTFLSILSSLKDNIVENIKARFKAKKYNIYTEKLDSKREAFMFLMGDWYANGKLYFGHPLFYFTLSVQNEWFIEDYPNGISEYELQNYKNKKHEKY